MCTLYGWFWKLLSETVISLVMSFYRLEHKIKCMQCVPLHWTKKGSLDITCLSSIAVLFLKSNFAILYVLCFYFKLSARLPLPFRPKRLFLGKTKIHFARETANNVCFFNHISCFATFFARSLVFYALHGFGKAIFGKQFFLSRFHSLFALTLFCILAHFYLFFSGKQQPSVYFKGLPAFMPR